MRSKKNHTSFITSLAINGNVLILVLQREMNFSHKILLKITDNNVENVPLKVFEIILHYRTMYRYINVYLSRNKDFH